VGRESVEIRVKIITKSRLNSTEVSDLWRLASIGAALAVDQSQAVRPELDFFTPLYSIFRLTIFSRFLARDKHLVQALPPVFTLQCLTVKVDHYY